MYSEHTLNLHGKLHTIGYFNRGEALNMSHPNILVEIVNALNNAVCLFFSISYSP